MGVEYIYNNGKLLEKRWVRCLEDIFAHSWVNSIAQDVKFLAYLMIFNKLSCGFMSVWFVNVGNFTSVRNLMQCLGDHSCLTIMTLCYESFISTWVWQMGLSVLWWGQNLSPGQMDLQVDASWSCKETCIWWPNGLSSCLASTCKLPKKKISDRHILNFIG